MVVEEGLRAFVNPSGLQKALGQARGHYVGRLASRNA